MSYRQFIQRLNTPAEVASVGLMQNCIMINKDTFLTFQVVIAGMHISFLNHFYFVLFVLG